MVEQKIFLSSIEGIIIFRIVQLNSSFFNIGKVFVLARVDIKIALLLDLKIHVGKDIAELTDFWLSVVFIGDFTIYEKVIHSFLPVIHYFAL